MKTMKTYELNKEIILTNDELAKFFATQILRIENYNFDVFYDIAKIMKEQHEARIKKTISRDKIISNYLLCIRPLGSDLINLADTEGETLEIYKRRAHDIFKIDICHNADYFFNEPYARVKEIK